MYKVLIADGEDIICRELASMVSRYSEMQIVALAEDGEIAFEKAKETLPDLILVDIDIPSLNGMELIEKICKTLPDAAIIIVTNCENFEFVQKALHLGVIDYILKPVMEQSFLGVLDKAVNMLNSMNHSQKYINWMEEQIEHNRPKMINDFFVNWLRGKIDDVGIEEQIDYLKIRIPVPYRLTVIHIYRDYEQAPFQNGGGFSVNLSYFDSLCNIAKKCFEPCSEVICFQTEKDELAVISKAFPQQQWERMERKLASIVDECFYAKIELVQQQGNSILEFPLVFQQAMKIMKMHKERLHYSDLVLQTMNIISMQWGNSDLSLLSVANSLFVSAPYLSKMFHRETGENFAAYLTRKRINEAKVLLKNTNMKMYEIAKKVGYTSQHYFSSAFKKNMGISPADYRKIS